MKPIFFFDYDNTTFSHWSWSIPDGVLEAMGQLQADGCKVILASGRALRASLMPAELAGHITPDGFNSSNGAYVEAEGKLLWENYLEPDLQKRLVAYAIKKNYVLMSGYEGNWYSTNLERFYENATEKQRGLNVQGPEAFQKIWDKPLPSFFIADTDENVADMQEHFPETRLLSMGHNMGADVIPRENGKVSGAKRILDYYHADWSDAVAVGDSMNDIDLIRQAGFGIAMGNAMEEVRRAADFVTSHIDEGGMVKAIQRAREWAHI